MIVVATHQTSAVDFIRPCLASIQKHMPLEPVCIVDQLSPDKSYMDDAGKDAVILERSVSHYEAGAWWTAFNCFPDVEFFYFIHDSMILQAPMDDLKDKELWVPGYLDNFAGCSEIHHKQVPEFLSRTTYSQDIPAAFHGPFGNVFFCQRQVMQRLKDHGVDQCLPTEKHGSESMERVWGICFQHEGFDVPKCSWGIGERVAMDRNGLPLRKYYGRRT